MEFRNWLLLLAQLSLNVIDISASEEGNFATTRGERDYRWPNRQLNVFIDPKTIRVGQAELISSMLEQIGRQTCLTVRRLPPNTDPNQVRQIHDEERNFIHIFQSAPLGQPSIGLSSLGCFHQGRQSMVLTESAFRYPQLVLKYHILRALGVQPTERPDRQLQRLLEGSAAGEGLEKTSQPGTVSEFSKEELNLVRRLYNCEERSASGGSATVDADSELSPRISRPRSDSNPQIERLESKIGEAAKWIVSDLLADTSSESLVDKAPKQDDPSRLDALFTASPSGQCGPMQSCLVSSVHEHSERSTTADQQGQSLASQAGDERPMLLKLDAFHAHDPQLLRANQIKLSQANESLMATYRLMDAPLLTAPASKSEMLISFEQSNPLLAGNPVAALASSQILKLCSCTCQTMTPSTGQPTEAPKPTDSHLPLTSDLPSPPTTTTPTTTTTTATTTTTTASPPEPTTITIEPPTTSTTTKAPTTTTTELPTPSQSGTEETTRPSEPSSSLAPLPTGEPPVSPVSPADNACDLVQWVKPNKTIYGSARIVWDMDRGNQNYFLCSTELNGEVVPGKTHGFSCKVSSEGKAFEMHNFNVLTKPETVNLAWVQRDSNTLGVKNLPVIGGFSKGQDLYVVSRCIVRDENNDVITLIGYVNSQGVGWFPFDDIQIECSQYDVLACMG